MSAATPVAEGRRQLTLLLACAVFVTTPVVHASDPPAPRPEPVKVPGALRKHLRKERFAPVARIAGLPEGVKEWLRGLSRRRAAERARMWALLPEDVRPPRKDWVAEDAVPMADPGEDFERSDAIMDPRLPTRSLVSAGCSADHCLLFYRQGGYALTSHVALFRLASDGAVLESGGILTRWARDLDEARSELLAGRVRHPDYW
jgi:hypothetical protein